MSFQTAFNVGMQLDAASTAVWALELRRGRKFEQDILHDVGAEWARELSDGANRTSLKKPTFLPKGRMDNPFAFDRQNACWTARLVASPQPGLREPVLGLWR